MYKVHGYVCNYVFVTGPAKTYNRNCLTFSTLSFHNNDKNTDFLSQMQKLRHKLINLTERRTEDIHEYPTTCNLY